MSNPSYLSQYPDRRPARGGAPEACSRRAGVRRDIVVLRFVRGSEWAVVRVQNVLQVHADVEPPTVEPDQLREAHVELIAPRPLYLSTGNEDRWSDPTGEFLAAQAASPVFDLFGLRGLEKEDFPPLDKAISHDIGFSCHTGKHDILPADWDRFLNFADLHLRHSS